MENFGGVDVRQLKVARPIPYGQTVASIILFIFLAFVAHALKHQVEAGKLAGPEGKLRF